MNHAPLQPLLVQAGEPKKERRTWLGRVLEVVLGRVATLVLAVSALALGIATFAVLAGGVKFGVSPNWVVGMVLANLIVLLLLGLLLAVRLTRVWVERRRGSAGSRLHVRLVLLFSVVAVVPAILVAVFATAFFHYGIQAWFNDRVRTALDQSLQVSRGYLEEHRNAIRADALAMADDLTRAGQLFAANAPGAFGQVLAEQTALRGLTEAVIFEPLTRQVIASSGLMAGLGAPPPPPSAVEQARQGNVAVLSTDHGTTVEAVARLDSIPPLMLMISRPVDPTILSHMAEVEQAVAEYKQLDANRYGLQITFALIFAMVAMLVLVAAVLIGLVMANQIARPVGRLILAAERVRAGDLQVRVPEVSSGDEIAGLSRAFNRMTGQLAAQRAELMDAYSQIDERRRFTENVLSGVSAGVIGLDAAGRIELPNRAAEDLLGLDLMGGIGRPLGELEPAFANLILAARAAPERALTEEVETGRAAQRRHLLVRIGAELKGGRPDGFVVTFDDITELKAAERNAAWADVARRIAHEIKNPLTPIQLAAERLKRRFLNEISTDRETFTQCADTIVRHVGDIGRMVDEFSAFARMPQPVFQEEDIGRLAREALVLQRSAHPEILFVTQIPEHGPCALCDRRLIGQALTNLLQNAADSVAMRKGAGRVEVGVSDQAGQVRISVADDGIGLPEEDRDRLAEPYVTLKPKGTGLGLAIVKKIMEDHGGSLVLEDRPGEPGALASLAWPMAPATRNTGIGSLDGA